jgi:transcription factor SOX9 (SOX group E)
LQNLGSTHQYQPSNQPVNQSQSSALYGDHVRTPATGWLSNEDRVLATRAHDKLHTYPSITSQSLWGRATSPAPPRSAPSYSFPTLNSPFYPSQSQSAGNHPVPGSAPAAYHASSGLGQGRRPNSAYGHRSFGPPTTSPNGYPSDSNRDLHMYQQHQSQHLPTQSMSSLSIHHINASSTAHSSSGAPEF